MSQPSGGRPADDRYIDTDDLFDKLDQLISRHQRFAPPAPDIVPVLTDAVDQSAVRADAEVPVLSDAVEQLLGDPAMHVEAASAERRRQLQVALYLRLRQRLDQELSGPTLAKVPADALAQIAHVLRTALPAIVRESVDQVFGAGERDGSPAR